MFFFLKHFHIWTIEKENRYIMLKSTGTNRAQDYFTMFDKHDLKQTYIRVLMISFVIICY